MQIETIVSFLTKAIIFFGLYMTIFWILVLINTKNKKNSSEITYSPVSLIIPAYNEENGIEKTIKSALALNYPGEIEVIVVNDASKDNTFKVAKKYDKKIKIIDKKKNAGKAAAINSALKIAKGKFIGVVDADSKISKNSVKNIIKYFDSDDNEKVGAVISKMKPDNESGNLLERIQLIEYMMVGLMRSLSSSIRLLHLTPGVLSMYNAKVLKKLGGFDQNNLTEDFEVGVRVRKAGYLVKYSYESPVYTTTPNRFDIFLKQRIRWSRGFIQTHKKHKNTFFNKKYGLFGLYQFPMNIAGPIIYFLTIFTISFNIYKQLYEFIFKLIYTPGVITWFEFDSLRDIILTLNPKIDLLILVSFILMLTLIYWVMKFYDYNFFKHHTLKKIWAFIVYVMVYNYIYIYVWIVSIIKESRGEKYNWGTK